MAVVSDVPVSRQAKQAGGRQMTSSGDVSLTRGGQVGRPFFGPRQPPPVAAPATAPATEPTGPMLAPVAAPLPVPPPTAAPVAGTPPVVSTEAPTSAVAALAQQAQAGWGQGTGSSGLRTGMGQRIGGALGAFQRLAY